MLRSNYGRGVYINPVLTSATDFRASASLPGWIERRRVVRKMKIRTIFKYDMERPSAKHSLHSQSNRTPRQHSVAMNRLGKIFRLFKPDGMTNVDWYYSLTNKTSWI